jgi:hypothetical protein
VSDDLAQMLADGYDDDTRYLALIRDLATATDAICGCHHGPMHRYDAAIFVNAILGNPELLWKLLACSARFEKQPPPHIDELKQSFWRRAARQASQSDGFGEPTSSDG